MAKKGGTTAEAASAPSDESASTENAERDAGAEAPELRDRRSLSRATAYRIAAEVDCDVRSVFKRYDGEPVIGRVGEKIIDAFDRHGVPYPRVLVVDGVRSYALPPGFTTVQVRPRPLPVRTTGEHAPSCRTNGMAGTYERANGDLLWRCCDALYQRASERVDLPKRKAKA